MVGFIAGWATILDYLIGIALAALFIPHYVAGAFGREGSVSAHQATALAVAIVLAITVVRLFRRRDVYTVGVAVSLLDLVVQAGMAVFGLALLFDWHALTADVDLGVKPTWSALAFAIPIAMIGFTGLEKVASLAGMAKNPAKDIPDSVRTSVFTVVLIYAAIATAATSAYPIKPDPGAPAHYSSELTTTWLDAPMLGLSHAIGTHLPDPLAIAVRLAVGLTATLILVLAITTSFSGCARLCDAMGERSPAAADPRPPRPAGRAAPGRPGGHRRAGDGLPGRGRGLRLERGGADAGLALQLRHPDLADAGQRVDRLAALDRAGHAARVHHARQRRRVGAADPGAGRARRDRRVRRVGALPGHARGRPDRRPVLDPRRAA